MRFGAALELWHKGELHAAEETANSPLEAQLEASIEQAKQKKAGVMEAVLKDVHLDVNTKAALVKLAGSVQSLETAEAFDLIDEQGLNQDEKIFLSSLLHSTIRTALKRERETRQLKAMPAQ